MRVVIDLNENDLQHFRDAMQRARDAAQNVSGEEIIAATRRLLIETKTVPVPQFVADRMGKLDLLIALVEDQNWHITPEERTEILTAMAYFVDPNDAIPDNIPIFGFVDDAIVIELVVEDLKHELEAYEDFCNYRLSPDADFDGDGKIDRDDWLQSREQELLERMRRRRGREGSYGGNRMRMFNH